MPDRPRNVGASVRQRLLNLAHVRGKPMELLLTRYALQRLQHRLMPFDTSPAVRAKRRAAARSLALFPATSYPSPSFHLPPHQSWAARVRRIPVHELLKN